MRHIDASGDYSEDPAIQAVIDAVTIPDDLSELWELERSNEYTIYDDTRNRLRLIESGFGRGDWKQAFFSTPLEDGFLRLLTASVAHTSSGVKKALHVIVNREQRTISDGMRLSYSEWALDDNHRLLSYASGVAEQASTNHTWDVHALDNCALLARRSDYLQILRGSNSRLLAPPVSWHPEGTEAFDVSKSLERLSEVLAFASPATYEMGVEAKITYR